MASSKKTARGKRKYTSDLYIHTRNAVKERFNHDLTEREHERMGEMIRSRRGTLVLSQTNTRFVYRLVLPFGSSGDFVDVFAVYQRPLKSVCTVLEEYMVKQLVGAELSAHANSATSGAAGTGQFETSPGRNAVTGGSIPTLV
ncbi:hypothetical protein [Deinococcus sp.]|uniref:hypothetical protein n=1 Tax=Deinococcus sp. TaxID=47478 RepID=UPI003B594C78